ncbi:MAG TPA: amidohydrolase family protein [bacterium]|nr:amidohydrolase family protein [bacterium]
MKKSWFFLLIFLTPMVLKADEPHCDILLKNGLIVDGTGLPPYRGDIALSGGKIAKIGDLGAYQADFTLDASGLVVAPGFIDLLCHNDLLWGLKEQERAVRGGVTSGLAGNCGFSVLDVQKNLLKLQKQHSLLNLGTLIGQGSVRDWFVKRNREKPASPQEMATMKLFVEGALSAGAFGLSSGLGYDPGDWCQPAELEDLASVLSRYPHAAYYTHIRNYRSNVLEAIREALQVGEKDKVPVVIQHLLFKLPSNWDQTERGLGLLEEARGRGQSVFATVYPYDFWGNEVQIPLAQFLYLPKDADRWAYYHDDDKRAEVLAGIRRRLQEYGGGDKIEITHVHAKAFKSFLGFTVKDMAQRRRISEEDAVLGLLLENAGDVKICYHGLSEEGLIKKIQYPYILFGSDSTGAIPHPRDVGAFPRLLGTYVRDKRVVRLSEAIHRLTQEPANLMGLKDRGVLKEGNWGDVVVFDPKTIRDNASAVSPWQEPTGMRMVLVNGQLVYDAKTSFSGRFPGQILRRSND